MFTLQIEYPDNTNSNIYESPYCAPKNNRHNFFLPTFKE
jgi:hypothetical protein